LAPWCQTVFNLRRHLRIRRTQNDSVRSQAAELLPQHFLSDVGSRVPGRRSASPYLRIDGTGSRVSIFSPGYGALLLRLPPQMWACSVSACIFLLTHFIVRQYAAKLLAVQLHGGEQHGS